MKKLYLSIVILCLLTIISAPLLVKAGGLVPCDTTCGISDFFTMLNNIYTFIVSDIATPLAGLAIMIGGGLILISAGNPGLLGTGKKIFWAGVIGLALALGSKIIINFILDAIGYKYGSV